MNLRQTRGERTSDHHHQAADCVFMDCWSLITIMSHCKTKQKKCFSEHLPDALMWLHMDSHIAESYLLQRLLQMDVGLKTMNILYILQTYRRLPLGPEVVYVNRSFMRKIRLVGGLIDWPVVLWNLLCVCFVSQHKGFVDSLFTNNKGMAKVKTVCALVTNLMDSWYTVAVKLLTPHDFFSHSKISNYWPKHKQHQLTNQWYQS